MHINGKQIEALKLLKLQYITVEQNGVFDDITLTLREDRNEELGEIDEYN